MNMLRPWTSVAAVGLLCYSNAACQTSADPTRDNASTSRPPVASDGSRRIEAPERLEGVVLIGTAQVRADSTTLEEAVRLLGPAKIFGESRVCYLLAGEPDAVIHLRSDEMGGPMHRVTTVEVSRRLTPTFGHNCGSLNLSSRDVRTKEGICLDQTEHLVEAVLGKPKKRVGNTLHYEQTREILSPTTDLGSGRPRMGEADELTGLEIVLLRGRVIAFTLWRTTNF